MLKYISNEAHYQEVIERSKSVKHSLWIGTADIKDLYIKAGLKSTKPYLSLLNDLITRQVSVRLLSAKEPGPAFQEDFDKFPLLIKHLEQAVCPRVHFKFFIFDLHTVYIGSANLTGAGLGMKSENHRNFEAGILTDEPEIVTQVMSDFDKVWNGSKCPKCKRKQYCPIPISEMY